MFVYLYDWNVRACSINVADHLFAKKLDLKKEKQSAAL